MIIFTRQSDAIDMNGVAIEQNWKAEDSITGVSISKYYPIAETQANIEANLTALFPATPVVSEDRLSPLRILKKANESIIVDDAGKPLLSIMREGSGKVSLKGFNSNGDFVSYNKQYLFARKTTISSSAADNSVVTWDVTDGSEGLSLASNQVVLKTGRKYFMQAALGQSNSSNQLHYQFYNVTSSAFIGSKGVGLSPNYNDFFSDLPAAAFLSPTVDTTVELRVHGDSTLPTISHGWMMIQEVG